MKSNSVLRFRFLFGITAIAFLMLCDLAADANARPVAKSKGGTASPQVFYRQRNTLSNIDFFFTNKGVLFNNDVVAGCNWPRGTVNSYIFGGGLWFATKKNISGSKRKLCELGYNPNSGAGWFTEGQIGSTSTSGEYISYVSPRYSKTDGSWTGGVNIAAPPPNSHWPIWDTSSTKTLNRNYYFGDYIDDESTRSSLAALASTNKPLPNGKIPKPAMLSQEDIVNVYSDADVSANPEYKAGSGYPFNLNVTEVIYSWSFGKYRDMMFIRRKVTNASNLGTGPGDTLFDCFVSPAFDPDLGVGGAAAQNDINSYFGLSHQDTLDCQSFFPPSSPYHSNPEALNMARQWSKTESTAVPPGEYGCIGFTFLESPVTASNGNIIDISDSAAVGGYCNGAQQLGLKTFKQWTISNDPPTPDLRYDFLASGALDHDISIVADMRLLFATGPFTLAPGTSVETTVGIGIARPSTTTVKLNQDSVVKLIAFAHQVFVDTTGTYKPADSNTACSVTVKHFITPVPPDLPNLTTQCLDRAVLVSWDNTADSSKDPLSAKTLAFNTYDLYRTTRSDHDSTIRPTGVNPTVHLGSWSLYNFRQDSLFSTQTLILKNGSTFIVKTFTGFQYTRINSVPNKIPHSFLDYGDDNGDGVLTGNEGLFNGVQYYYFILATDEFDSVNNVGPLTTAVVNGKNFAVGIPCRPIFPDLPNTIAGDSSCVNGSLTATTGYHATKGTSVTVDIQDTGKFLQLYTNDTISVSFQPRWTEAVPDRNLNLSTLSMYVDVRDTRQGKELTYDKLFNPSASPVLTPYSFLSGIVQQVIGMTASPDSNIVGRFSTNNSTFQPNQTIDQAFDLLVDYDYQQLIEPYRLNSITFNSNNKGTPGIVGISGRTSRAPVNTTFSYADIPDSLTIPSFQGALGVSSYEIDFGQDTTWSEYQFDSTKGVYLLDNIKDPNTAADFHPMALPVTVIATSHCNQQLSVIRPGNRNDVAVENDARYYNKVISQPPNVFPDYTNPDTMIVPLAGKFAIDAFHFAETTDGDPSTATPLTSTTGRFYFTHGLPGYQNSGEFLETVHRFRLGGAELIFNFPGISTAQNAGDTASYSGPFANDFQPGDKITVSFTGLVRGLPFPGAEFVIYTSKLNFADNALYQQSKLLDEVQVVPNPYFVDNIGQTSTDNAKLFFTRLPPRATIEIYNLAGQLVKTIEHVGLVQTANGTDSLASNGSVILADRYNVEIWNLLSEGKQRVGSQVFIARVIAKDPKDGVTVLGEMVTKFAVVVGGYRLVH